MNNLMTIKEVADYVGFSTQWVRKRIKTEELKAVNISNTPERKHWRIRREDLEEFINGRN